MGHGNQWGVGSFGCLSHFFDMELLSLCIYGPFMANTPPIRGPHRSKCYVNDRLITSKLDMSHSSFPLNLHQRYKCFHALGTSENLWQCLLPYPSPDPSNICRSNCKVTENLTNAMLLLLVIHQIMLFSHGSNKVLWNMSSALKVLESIWIIPDCLGKLSPAKCLIFPQCENSPCNVDCEDGKM